MPPSTSTGTGIAIFDLAASTAYLCELQAIHAPATIPWRRLLLERCELMLDSESDASSADAMRVQHAHMGRPIDDVFRLIDAAIAGTLAPGDDQWNAASATASSCPVDQQMPLMLAEELFECMAIETCASAFDFIEKRMPQLAHNLQPGRGKGLVLLRLCNELLKRLSKAHDATFCGRILTVLASVYPLAERSGVNQAGHFHVENVTDYATKDTFDYTPYTRDEFAFKPSAVFPTLQSAVVVPDDSVEGAGMDHAEAAAPANDDDKTTDTIDDKDEMPVTPMSAPPAVKKESPGTIFYSLLWKWQSFAANPEQCITDCKQFRLMQRCLEAIQYVFDLAQASELKIRANQGKTKASSSSSLPSRTDAIRSSTPFAKFLTAPNLLPLQVNNVVFRRTVLVQARILLDHLQRRIRMERDKSAKVIGAKEAAVVVDLKTGASKSPSKKGDETPVLTEAQKTLAFLEEQMTWIDDARAALMKHIERSYPHGLYFANILKRMMAQEEQWVQWKVRDSCKSFDQDPVHLDQFSIDTTQAPKRFAPKCEFGNEELARLWAEHVHDTPESTFESKAILVPELKTYLQPFYEQLDPDDMIEEEYRLDNDMTFVWSALRLTSMRYMQLLAKTAGAKLEPLAIELFGAYPERIEDMADVVLEDTVMESSPGPIVGEEMKIDSKASVTNESMVDVEMDEVREKSPAHKSSPSQSMHSPLRSPSLLPPIDSPRRQSSEAQEKNNQDDSAMEVDEHAPLGQ